MGKKRKQLPVVDSYIKRAYFNIKEPTSYSSLSTFAKARKQHNIKDLQKSLNKIKTYTVFRGKKKPIFRPIFVFEEYQLLHVDLIDMHTISPRINQGMKMIMLAIDVFSKYVYAYPIKDRTSASIAKGFLQLFRDAKGKIKSIQTDAESAILGKHVQEIFKKYDINHYVTHTPRKAAVAEKAILRIKRSLWIHFFHTKTNKWVDVLDDIIRSYNHTYHSSIKAVPALVKKSDYSAIWQNLYKRFANIKPPKQKLEVGALVRITMQRFKPHSAFVRGYHQTYTSEVFKIQKVHETYPVFSYKLTDLNDIPIAGTFTTSELIEVEPESQNDDRP